MDNAYRGPMPRASSPNWEYDGHMEFQGKTFHVWRWDRENDCNPPEPGFVMYQVSPQPLNGKGSFYKPKGKSGWTSLEAFNKHFNNAYRPLMKENKEGSGALT